MENYGERFTAWRRRWRKFTVAGTGSIVLCFGSCLSAKKSERTERLVETERIEQEVILLPASERIIVDPELLIRMPESGSKPQKEGLSVRKRKDGLIEIEHRSDTVRVRDVMKSKVELSDQVAEQKAKNYSFGTGLFALLTLTALILTIKK